MGVYIKGIEMPKGADEYRLIIRSNGQVIIDKKTYWEEAEAVSVPPHGRLIDADAVFDNLERTGWYDNADRDIAEDLVLDAPTIIPASEEGK